MGELSGEKRRQREKANEAQERHAVFRQEPDWKKKIYRNEEVLAGATAAETRVVISLQDQRVLLFHGELLALDGPVATGRRSHPTPTGQFSILEKKTDHRSNLYGKILSVEGEVVVSDADRRSDAVPEGGNFAGAPMPFWMRLTNTGVGMHVGRLPGYPASHGCIRLPKAAATEIYALVKVGTPVEIVPLFTPPSKDS